MTVAFRAAAVSAVETENSFEKKVNGLLDNINDAKRRLLKRTEEVNNLIPKIEELTWFTDVDEETLTEMKGLISNIKELYKLMLSFWVQVSRNFAKHQVAKTELKGYREAADEVREMAGDLEARFFTSPQDDEFQAIANTLNGL